MNTGSSGEKRLISLRCASVKDSAGISIADTGWKIVSSVAHHIVVRPGCFPSHDSTALVRLSPPCDSKLPACPLARLFWNGYPPTVKFCRFLQRMLAIPLRPSANLENSRKVGVTIIIEKKYYCNRTLPKDSPFSYYPQYPSIDFGSSCAVAESPKTRAPQVADAWVEHGMDDFVQAPAHSLPAVRDVQ